MIHPLRSLLVALFLIASLRGQVTIDRVDAVIERRTFDPKNPPAEMPPLTGNEAAITQSFFGAEARVGGNVSEQPSTSGKSAAAIKVDTVSMTVRLRVIVWLPLRATKKLTDHEEAHRAIAEHYYADAEAVARDEAQKLIGQTVSGEGADLSQAGDAALNRAAVELGQRYLGRVDTPCGKAQEIFDKITKHGTNAVKEEDAIKQSIAGAAAAK